MIPRGSKQEEGRVDPDFSREVVADLYRFYPRRLWIAACLGTLGGLFGAHRFYCWRPWTGLAMLFSLGGGGLWWLWDLCHLRALVQDSNAGEQQRLARGLAPRGMGFLPAQDELRLDEPPRWAARRGSRGRILGSAVLLWLIGLSLGTVSRSTGIFEPVLVLLLFIAATLLAARWKGMAHIPVLRNLNRWVHRLRLYYHSVDPGNLWLLATRPLFGLFIAPWQPKARMEVRLYLQLGGVMALLLAAADVADVLASDSLRAGIGILIAEIAQTLVYTYLFVAPAGALLTTQLLLTRRDPVVWTLSAITVYSIYVGYAMTGA